MAPGGERRALLLICHPGLRPTQPSFPGPSPSPCRDGARNVPVGKLLWAAEYSQWRMPTVDLPLGTARLRLRALALPLPDPASHPAGRAECLRAGQEGRWVRPVGCRGHWGPWELWERNRPLCPGTVCGFAQLIKLIKELSQG